jgi:hypothetical protein
MLIDIEILFQYKNLFNPMVFIKMVYKNINVNFFFFYFE